jgi:predicted transglutaminase-like cysteine proteinase
VNSAKYRRDDSRIGMGSDCWATPGQLFADGGDCEDYAIAKYLSLRRLGFLPNALHIQISYNRTTCKVHAALVAILDGEALLLDNRLPRVVPAERNLNFVPLYAFNEQRWWLHRAKDVGP